MVLFTLPSTDLTTEATPLSSLVSLKPPPFIRIHSLHNAKHWRRHFERQPSLYGSLITDRLRLCRSAWRELVQDPWALSMVTHGFSLLLHTNQNLSYLRPLQRKSEAESAGPKWGSEMQLEVRRMVEMGAFAHVKRGGGSDVISRDFGLKSTRSTPSNLTDHQVSKGSRPNSQIPGEAGLGGKEHFSRLFSVRKETGSIRLILDFRALNKCLNTEHFRMESRRDLREILTPQCWMTTIDLKDAYLHVAIADAGSRSLLRFNFRGEMYESVALMFGLNLTPRVFTKLLRPVIGLLRKMGVCLLIYLDDLIVIGRTQAHCCQSTWEVLWLLVKLGWQINWIKSQLTPEQEKIWLGLLSNTISMQFLLPLEKVETIKEMCRKMSEKSTLTLYDLGKLVGKLESCRDAVVQVRHGMTSLRHQLRVGQRPKWQSRKRIELNSHSKAELTSWHQNLSAWNGRPIKLPAKPSKILASDASPSGWGGCIIKSEVAVEKGATAHGYFGRRSTALERQLLFLGDFQPSETHINLLELAAFILTVRSFVQTYQWHDIHILHMVDNQVAMAYINRAGGRIWKLAKMVADFEKFCASKAITFHATWLKSEKNVIADALSRLPRDPSDWRLETQLFQLIESQWGPHDVDLFASYQNTQLKRYVSRFPDPTSIATDAFSIHHQWWKWGNLYANPPFALMLKLLARIRDSPREVEMTVVAPIWPTRPWWPLILDLATEVPKILPPFPGMFISSYATKHRPIAPTWIVAAWRLSSSFSKAEARHKQLKSCTTTDSLGQLVGIMTEFLDNGPISAGTRAHVSLILRGLGCPIA